MERHSKTFFSIITPVYNREETISKAITSVLEQTFADFEMLIIDDGSTDATLEMVQSFSDNRIKIMKTPKNDGAAAARNLGIQAANGSYISFLDSDDFYQPDFLQESFNILEKSSEKIGFMWTGLLWNENNTIKQEFWEPKFNTSSYITFLNSLHIGTNSGITVKREVFDVCGYFDENLKAAEDTDFFLRITQQFDYKYSPKYLITINRDGKDRLSKDLKKNAEAYSIIFPKHKNTIDTSKVLQKKYYYKMMWLSFYLPNKKLGSNYFIFLVKNNLISFKSLLIYFNYLFLPLRQASYIHRKISILK
jgi:glycosyltransferase involved in cell wall biosynthesis